MRKARVGKITAQDVIDLMSYDEETGIFIRIKTSSNAKAGDIAGSLDGNGYRLISIKGSIYSAHRLAMLISTGEWPDYEIDHINGIRDDNRIKNLRLVSHLENGRNLPIPKNNKSGVIGVSRHKATGKWIAQITVADKRLYLGVFSGFSDAVEARRRAEIEHGFHENHGRTPKIRYKNSSGVCHG